MEILIIIRCTQIFCK